MNAQTDIGSVLDIRNLCKSFGRERVVDDIDIRVNRGDIVGFLGPNGAGKTTTMTMIAGLQHPDKGQIKLFGISDGNRQPELRARIGYLQEKPRIYPEMSAQNYLMYFAELYGVASPASKVGSLLDRLNLSHATDRVLGTFSRGMQQRVCLARVMLHNPEFLMLDEPTLGLDPAGVAEMREIFRELNSQGVTLLFSSHQLAEMERVCDRIILMEKGKIIASGRQKDLLPTSSDNSMTVEIDEPITPNLARLNAIPGISSASQNEDGELLLTLNQSAASPRADLSRLLTANGFTVLGIKSSNQTLEELFLKLTTNPANSKNIPTK